MEFGTRSRLPAHHRWKVESALKYIQARDFVLPVERSWVTHRGVHLSFRYEVEIALRLFTRDSASSWESYLSLFLPRILGVESLLRVGSALRAQGIRDCGN